MAALADVGCPVRVTGLVAAAENAIGGNATAPRRRASATTAAAPPRSPTPTPRAGWCSPTRWRTPSTSSTPTSLVDVATLTGGIKVALGQQVGGFFANDDALADALLRRRRDRGRAAVAVAAVRRLRGQAVLQGRRRRQRPRRTRRRSPPRCSSSTSPATCPGPTSTSPRSATSPEESFEWTDGPDRLRRPRAARLARLRRPAGRSRRDAGPHRPLVARRRPRRRRGRAGDVRRRHLARAVHRHGRASRFKTWRCARASGSRAATSSPPTRPARRSRRRSPRAPPSRRARRSSAARRS